MFYVYLLYSLKDSKFYAGSNNDLDRRVKDHEIGKVESTRHRRPFKLVYYEAHLSKEDALRREKYFKTSKGK